MGGECGRGGDRKWECVRVAEEEEKRERVSVYEYRNKWVKKSD